MKKIFLSVVAGMVSVATFAQTWSLDKAHSNVSFTITHMMISEVDGSFKNFDAKLTSSKPAFADAQLEFTAQVANINTGNEMRDGHLQGADWFDAAKHAVVSFKSTSVKRIKGDQYKILGNFTMKGVTKPMSLIATLKGPVENLQSKKQIMGIKATGTVDRTAFGVGEAGKSLGSTVTFKVSGEFSKD